MKTTQQRVYPLKCLEGGEPRILVTEDFVVRNNLRYARTQKEIKQRIIEDSENIFSFAEEVLVPYLDWENAKSFYKKEYVKKVEKGKEKAPERINDIYETAQDFLDYMVFAWMKSMDERGLSASRSIAKLGHWLWLMGRDDLRRLIDDDELYNPYGAPALVAVCEQMGIPIPKELVKFSKRKIK